MPRIAAIVAVLLSSSVLGGCALQCTTELRYAVHLQVLDAGGNELAADRIVYTVDGGEAVTVTCNDGSSEGGRCIDGDAYLGPEREGRYHITVFRGDATATAMVDVGADNCHVQTEEVTIEMPLE